jgi:osmoprotectant transport system permease protein
MLKSARPSIRTLEPLLYISLFLFCIFCFPDIERLLKPIIQRKTIFIERDPLWKLALEHLGLVSATSLSSGLLAFGLALLVSRDGFENLRKLLLSATSFVETVPTIAVMALLIPLTGYGFVPVAISLFLYALLPVFRNTLSGILGTSQELVDSAKGAGMDESQILWKLRLPLALPLILQGFRISIVINISAATIGAVVGAGGLGIPIVSGIRSFDGVLILQGSLPVAFLALFFSSVMNLVKPYEFYDT